MAYLPEWGRPRFLCRRCGVAFDEAAVRLAWQDDQVPITGERPASGGPSSE